MQQVGAYGIAGYLMLRTPLGIGLRIERLLFIVG
jgi:hypothetical protein